MFDLDGQVLEIRRIPSRELDLLTRRKETATFTEKRSVLMREPCPPNTVKLVETLTTPANASLNLKIDCQMTLAKFQEEAACGETARDLDFFDPAFRWNLEF